jgi:hypothetical protein
VGIGQGSGVRGWLAGVSDSLCFVCGGSYLDGWHESVLDEYVGTVVSLLSLVSCRFSLFLFFFAWERDYGHLFHWKRLHKHVDDGPASFLVCQSVRARA